MGEQPIDDKAARHHTGAGGR